MLTSGFSCSMGAAAEELCTNDAGEYSHLAALKLGNGCAATLAILVDTVAKCCS